MKGFPSRYVRTPSLLEQLYLDGAELGYNLTPRAYVKLSCAPCKTEIQDALERLRRHMPDLNLCYEKKVWKRALTVCPLYWVESGCEEIMQVSVPDVDWRTHTISLAMIHLSKSDEWYLCFSMFHGIGDGFSLTQFIYAFFAALNHQLCDAYDFTMTEHDFPEQTGNHPLRFPLKLACEPVASGAPGSRFRIARTESAPYIPTSMICTPILPFVPSQKAYMVIPVNIRRFCQPSDKIRMGNLVAPMFLSTAGKSSAELRSDIHMQVTTANLPIFGNFIARAYRFIPRWLRQFVLRNYAASIQKKGKTPCVAMVSNVGKVQPEALQAPGFQVTDCWYAFENLPLFSITLLTVSFGDHSNTCISTHYSRMSNQAAQSIANQIAGLDVNATVRQR